MLLFGFLLGSLAKPSFQSKSLGLDLGGAFLAGFLFFLGFVFAWLGVYRLAPVTSRGKHARIAILIAPYAMLGLMILSSFS